MTNQLQSIASFPVRVLILAVFLLCAAPVAAAADEKPPEDHLITLDVKNKPLGNVLEELQLSTGTSFSLDIQWKDIPVSVSLVRTPLHEGLKRILAKLNTVIIYESNSKVKIFVLGKIEPSKAVTGPIGLPLYQPTPANQQPAPPQTSDSEPVEPEETPEPEPVPEVEKEEVTEVDSNAVSDEGKGEVKVAGDAEDTGLAESEEKAGSPPQESGKPSEDNSPTDDAAADNQDGG